MSDARARLPRGPCLSRMLENSAATRAGNSKLGITNCSDSHVTSFTPLNLKSSMHLSFHTSSPSASKKGTSCPSLFCFIFRPCHMPKRGATRTVKPCAPENSRTRVSLFMPSPTCPTPISSAVRVCTARRSASCSGLPDSASRSAFSPLRLSTPAHSVSHDRLASSVENSSHLWWNGTGVKHFPPACTTESQSRPDISIFSSASGENCVLPAARAATSSLWCCGPSLGSPDACTSCHLVPTVSISLSAGLKTLLS